MRKARLNTEGDVLGIYNVESFININTALVADWILVDVTDNDVLLINQGYRYINDFWIAPPPIEPVIIVPQTISKMKLRMQLILSGIPLASIYAAIEQIPDSVQKEIVYTKWEHAVTFDRTDETLNAMAQMLGMTQKQLDTIFIEGNKLQ
jgi:hypothetical protein